MLLVAGASIIFLFFITLSGFPLAKLIIGKNGKDLFLRFPTILTLSILLGFFLSAISSTISYGLIGIDLYPAVFMVLASMGWITYIFFAKKNSLKIFRIRFFRSDFSLLYILIWCLVLTRSQWESLTSPRLVSGDGPDTSQNLMAALSARSLGSTWWTQSDRINTFFGNESLRESVYDLYRYPSFRDQAGFDYLVFGTRWGLSIPYSQILRFFGDHAILWETGVVLTISLLVLGFMVYGVASLLSSNQFAPLATSIVAVSNSLLLYQYFNGGLSQLWSLPGILGISLILVLIISGENSELSTSGKQLIFLSTASWVVLFSTYVDAAIILALLVFIVAIVFFFVNRQISARVIKVFLPGGIFAIALNPVLSYATAITFDLRLRAATGTGLPSKLWAFPSEILGFVDVFSNSSDNRSFETTVVGLLLTISILYILLKKALEGQHQKNITILAIACLVMMFLGFILSSLGKLQTSYIYQKVSIYVAPLLLILWMTSFRSPNVKSQVNGSKMDKSINTRRISRIGYLSALSFFTSIAMLSSFSATSNTAKIGTSIPYEFSTLLKNKNIQERIREYNYLTPYIISANFLGVVADVHWVSKAPNDIKLDSRVNNEMRLMCFSNDTNCKPNTKRIVDLELESYGLLQFESPISSIEFSKLPPRERYRVNFEVFGIAPQAIPERFIGGNPYYN